MAYGPDDRVSAVVLDDDARALLDRHLPGGLDSPMIGHLRFLTLGAVVDSGLFGAMRPGAADLLWGELAALPGSAPAPQPEPAPIQPRTDYEPESVGRGSARWEASPDAALWDVAEVVLHGPSHGNPFVDVELTATFRNENTAIKVGGFYDGDGVYRIRLAPPEPGSWSFVVHSTARSLDSVSGSFAVGPAKPGNHGPVRVADTFHFAHADGTRHHPIGTTLYAWTHQPEVLEERTLATLTDAAFTKVRMCVFPKSYLFNTNEPPRYPFARDDAGEWDFTRFEPDYFRHLEQRIHDLAALGIQADLILFHAYDRWGFSEMPRAADDRYLRYVVRRLAAQSNVWWSLANEYDLVLSKRIDDWERFAEIVQEEDHVGHLLSIHNCFGFYDHSRPWVTHVSAQRIDVYRTAENTDLWRQEYGKPVVIDEVGYEGDIDQGWGNLSGQELVRRMWEGAVRGGYVNHGETYLNDRDELWWSKGGELVGDSPARVRFLRDLLEHAPGQRLDPLPSNWDVAWGGSDEYRIAYFGFERPRYRDVVTPPGTYWTVDVIDTWGMTIERLPGTFGGSFRVPLPAREYMAIRLQSAPEERA